MRRRRVGRPALKAADKQSKTIGVRLRPAAYRRLVLLAGQADEPVTTYAAAMLTKAIEREGN